MTALDDPKVDADFVPVDLAVDYARWGWPAMPVALARKPDGTISKRPLTSHGHLDATTDTSALMEMFARAVADLRNGEVLGVGVVPGRADCVVFDHDIKHGGVGDQTFAVLVDEHGADWATCRYRSVSGGLNVVVRKLDAGCCIGNHSPWPSVDIRADSGWIVAPGTVTPWGSWTWERDPDDEAHPLATVPACPVTMWKLLRPSSGPAAASRVTTDEVDAWIKSSPGEWDADARRSFDRSLRRLRDAKPGGRHQAMVEAVGSLVGAVFANHPAGIEAVFSVWAQATAQELHRAEEPWDAIAWAVGREIANGRTTASLGGAARLDLPTRVIDDGELWTSTPGGFNLDASRGSPRRTWSTATRCWPPCSCTSPSLCPRTSPSRRSHRGDRRRR